MRNPRHYQSQALFVGLLLALAGHSFVGWNWLWGEAVPKRAEAMTAPSSKPQSESVVDLSIFTRVHGTTLATLTEPEEKGWQLPKGILVEGKRVQLANLESISRYSEPLNDVRELEGFGEWGILGRLYEERPYAKDTAPYFDPKMRFTNEDENPFRHLTPRDYDEMEKLRKQELKNWSKQTMQEESSYIVSDADRDSAPIHTMWTLRKVLGGHDLFGGKEVRNKKAAERKRRDRVSITAEEKAASQKEPDIARLSLVGEPKKKEEEDEVRLKSKLNLTRRMGRLDFANPVLLTGAQLDLKSKERVEFKAAKELKSLATETSVVYGVEHKSIAMNLSKKITEEVSCELKSTKSPLPTVISEEAMKLNYLIHF